jgi:hypothetical protein
MIGTLAQVNWHMKDEGQKRRAENWKVTNHLLHTARCLLHRGKHMLLTYWTLKANSKSKNAALRKTKLQDWSAMTAESEKHMWYTKHPNKKGNAAINRAKKLITRWALD